VKLTVLCPHFAPDPAPTGEVITRIVLELAERGHELHVVTALPWYTHHRVEDGWGGRLVRREATPWGSVTRVHPFPSDKTSLPLRAVSFSAFSALSGVAALGGGRMDAVLAMSPPLPIGLVAWAAAVFHRCPLVFNVQDVFPDVAVDLSKLTDPRLVRVARWLERTTYARAAAVTVLSEDLRANIAAKVRPDHRGDVRVIPNFVDTDAIQPMPRATAYRRELGIGDDQTVVLYAGNVGFSQSLDLLVEAARRLAHRPELVFVVNGGGSGLADVRASAQHLRNVRFAPYQPRERLPEVLATGDLHVVLLRRGLATASVPSKTYSILAAGRPLLASIDPGTEVPRVVAAAGCGVSVRPDDADAFTAAVESLTGDGDELAAMGRRGRAWVERWVSAAAVAEAYEALFDEVCRGGKRPRRAR
jgi:colanic acid biosynthesis glycosyl transferase WcaI